MRIFPAFGFSEEDDHHKIHLGNIPQKVVENRGDPLKGHALEKWLDERGLSHNQYYWYAQRVNGDQADLFIYIPKSHGNLAMITKLTWSGQFVGG